MHRTTEQPTTTKAVEWVFSLLIIGSVATVWIALFKLNLWLFASIGVSQFISWIFLPAAIRMLSVMLFDGVGAIGLFIGAVITSNPLVDHNLSSAIILAGLSALGPMVAVTLCTKWLNLPPNLAGLGPRQLSLYALVGALCNVIPHNIYFYFSGKVENPLEGVFSMFTGDVLGTLIVLYVSALFLRVCVPQRTKKPVSDQQSERI